MKKNIKDRENLTIQVSVPCDVDIKYIKLNDEVCVYSVIISHDGMLMNSIYRLCYTSELEDLYKDPIKFAKSGSRDLDQYNLFKPTIREAEVWNLSEVYNNNYTYKGLTRPHVFKYIINNGIKEEFVLGKINFGENNFYEYGKEYPYPRKIRYSCSDAQNASVRYDLEKVVDELLKRKDITFYMNEVYICGNKENIIQQLAYFNGRYIYFTWYPQESDWNEYCKRKKDDFLPTDDIIDEILNIKQYRIVK